MYRLQCRDFGSHETLVTSHTVDANGSDRAGVRWYELRRSGGAWGVHQAGTFSPEAVNRWMGDVAMDAAGSIAVGYSGSSSSVYPGIRWAARLATDAPGTLAQSESTVVAGGGSQTHAEGRWGDYSSMSLDPVDDCTFWYTQEYMASTRPASRRCRSRPDPDRRP